MRKKIGKRIGPVPIALVAVFALAAFISAGLWVVPNGAQAQDATIALSGDSIPDFVFDVDQAVTAADKQSVRALFDIVADAESVGYTSQASTATAVLTQGEITFDADGNIIISQDDLGPPGTTTITVQGSAQPSGGGTPITVDAKFDIVVIQNPIQLKGVMVTNPDPVTDISNDEDTLGNQWPDGKCEVTTADADVFTSRAYDANDNGTAMPITLSATDGGRLVSGGDCLSADDTLEVTFSNTSLVADDDVTLLVYVTGGDDLSGIEPEIAEEGLDEHVIELPVGFAGDPSKETITVSRSMGDSDGIVYLLGYTSPTSTNNLGDDDTTFGADADFVVKAVFLDPPVEKNAAGDIVSMITARDDDVGSKDETVMLDVLVRDANSHPVSGFIDLTVEGPASVVFTASSLKTHRTKLNARGMASVAISGLPKTDPFKIKVTGTIGDLTLEEDIVRTGDAEMVEATAYSCKPDRDDEDAAGQDRGVCASEIDAIGTPSTSDDPSELGALGPEGSFVIGANAFDSAGNKVGSGNMLTWKIDGDADNADDAEDTLIANAGRTSEMITVAGSDDAVPGTYTLTVTSPDGEASTMITITVSDNASMLTVSCDPEMIPTDSGLTNCTVTVTDENGNIPSNLVNGSADSDDDSRVLVIVRSEGASLSGVDDSGYTDLDAKGMASFSVVLREDAREGNVTVFVSTDNVGSTTLRANTSVMYGEALAMPMNVMAEATSDTMITVSWDAVSGATGYMVERGYMNDMGEMMWMTVDAMVTDTMYMDSGLMAETAYYYRVTAMNAAGSGDASDGMAMATTDASASTELTAPSGVVVSSLPNTQSVSVTWDTTSIQNAEQIKVVLFNSDVTGTAKPLITINAANDPGSATFNDVPDGMYIVVVASFRTGERHKLSDLEEVTVE